MNSHPVWNTGAEYSEYLRFLNEMCACNAHEIVASTGTIKFGFSAIQTDIGFIDILRFQSKDRWELGVPWSAMIGQGMFKYEGSIIHVNDLCNTGYKFILPDPTPHLYTVKSSPSLGEVVIEIKNGKNVSDQYKWDFKSYG